MAGSVKGIIVEIGGDTSGLQKALSKVNSATSSLSKELRGVNSLLKLDPKNTELVSEKQILLAQRINTTEEKLKNLKQVQEEAEKAMQDGTEISQENYRALQQEIIRTEQKLKEFKLEASKWTTAGKAIENIGSKIDNIGSKIDRLGGKLTARVTTPLIALGVVGTKSAMEQEAAMQQVDLIYGDASKTIKDFAENTAVSFNMSTKDAYKYSQIYGNLIQSITDDTKENATYTQQLLKASSVIASATGRTMEDVMDRIRSGLLGNTEAIEDLGVNVNVSLLESTDAFKKFAGDKSWKQLDFQTQQQIRLFGILEQTTKKYGSTVNQNTASSVQKLSAKFNNLTSKLSKKLLPIANNIIDTVEKFIDQLDNLSDKEQENIIKTGLMVIAIGPAIKILGKLTTVTGKTFKAIGTFSQAIGVLRTGAKSTSNTVNNLAKVIGAITSPAGLAAIGITGIATAMIYLTTKETEAQKESKAFANEISKSKKSLEEYNKSIDESTNANLSHINSVSELKDELVLLVDENGKVKEGYKSRVDFILKNYKDMQQEIDNLIQKKKAEIKLNSDEEKYKNAIENQEKAVISLRDAHDKLGMSYNDAKDKLKGLQEEFDKQKYVPGINGLLKSSKIEKEMSTLRNLIKAYEDAEWEVKDYTEKVKTYTDNYEKFVEGKYNDISNIVVNTTQDWNKKSLEELKKSIQEQGKNLKIYKEIYVNTGNDIALQLSQQAQRNLDNLSVELLKRTNTIQELGQEEVNAWKEMAQNSYETYSYEISKMTPEMQNKIQQATGIIAAGTPKMQEKAKELGTKTVEEFDKSADAKQKALNVISSYLKGLTNEEKRELLEQVGIENADIVLNELDKGNLSEENGKNILKGLWNGLSNSTWQGRIIKVASGLAKAVNKAFTGKDGWDEHSPSKKMKQFAEYYIQPISDTMQSRQKNIVASAKKLANKVNSVFASQINLSQMQDLGKMQRNLSNKIINQPNTIYTTPQIIFNVQELDEEKLQQCFNYINKKFGSAY